MPSEPASQVCLQQGIEVQARKAQRQLKRQISLQAEVAIQVQGAWRELGATHEVSVTGAGSRRKRNVPSTRGACRVPEPWTEKSIRPAILMRLPCKLGNLLKSNSPPCRLKWNWVLRKSYPATPVILAVCWVRTRLSSSAWVPSKRRLAVSWSNFLAP